MKREKAIESLIWIKENLVISEDFKEALDMSIEALQDKIDEDLISRADAMGAVQDHFNAYGFKGYYDGQRMMDRINALPPAGLAWRPFPEPYKGGDIE